MNDSQEFVHMHRTFSLATYILNKSDGDEEFRKMEDRRTVELGIRMELVNATRGRFILNPHHVNEIKKNSCIICLAAELREIVCRIQSSGNVTYHH